ncbi:MAG: nucleotidyltransferase family protein [Halieaceae bacterium]|nr:nucleotidyltransferase family protein [Halieaceae bacterium]
MKTTNTAALILAAGFSRRFRSDKRTAEYRSGESLLQASVKIWIETAFPVYLSLSDRADDQAIADAFAALPLQVLRCAQAHEGMGATIAESIGLLAPAAPKAIAIALGDMPLLKASTLRALAERAGEDRIVIPVFNGRRGHPVFFGSCFLGALQELEGDRGAAGVLRANADACVELPVDDPGIHLDADTPAELEALRRR